MAERNMELLQEFGKVSTGNVADAMMGLGYAPNAVLGLVPVYPQQKPAVGYAFTMKQMQHISITEKPAPGKQSKVADELAAAGDLIVIDAGGRTDISTAGGLILARAKLRGVEGYLVNGCLRDVDEIMQMDLPVYYKGSCPVKSAPNIQTVYINDPVEIGGVCIRNGDIIMMDASGVVVVPIEIAEQVLEKAKRINIKEEAWMKMMREDGLSFAEAKAECIKRFG